MAAALAFRGGGPGIMAGSDEGLQSALYEISDPAFEASTPALAPFPGILPGRTEPARRSALVHGPGAASTLCVRRFRLLRAESIRPPRLTHCVRSAYTRGAPLSRLRFVF